jgi:hypothetical protein
MPRAVHAHHHPAKTNGALAPTPLLGCAVDTATEESVPPVAGSGGGTKVGGCAVEALVAAVLLYKVTLVATIGAMVVAVAIFNGGGAITASTGAAVVAVAFVPWITVGEGAGMVPLTVTLRPFVLLLVVDTGAAAVAGDGAMGATAVIVHSTRAVAARQSRWIHTRSDSVRNAIGDAAPRMEMPVLLLPVLPLVQHEMSSAVVVVAVVAVFHKHEAHTSAAYAAVTTDSNWVTIQFTVTVPLLLELLLLESLVVAVCVMDVAVMASACNCNKASNSTRSSVPLASTSAITKSAVQSV